MIEDQLRAWLGDGLRTAAPGLGLDGDLPEPELQEPRQKDHGDFATNVALALAKRAGAPPRKVAEALVARPRAGGVRREGRGRRAGVHQRMDDRRLAARHGADDRRRGRAVRPRASHRRARPGGVREREPDGPAARRPRAQRRPRRRDRAPARGRRATRSSASTTSTTPAARWTGSAPRSRRATSSALGRDAEVPEDGYHGEYVAAYAADIVREQGDALADLPPEERFVRLRTEGARRAMDGIRETLARFGVRVRHLRLRGDARGARRDRRRRSIASSPRGRSTRPTARCGSARPTSATTRTASWSARNGRHTYFGADCAYLIDKFRRGFDHLVYVWGADHHGDVVRVKGAAGRPRVRPEPGRADDLPVRGVPARRRAGADEQAGRARSSRWTSCSTRSAPTRRGSTCCSFSNDSLDAVRHRGGHAADDGEPRLLRAVRARADRLDRAEGRRCGDRAASARYGGPLAPRTGRRARAPAGARRRAGGPRARRRAPSAAPRRARRAGRCRAVPSLLHRVPRGRARTRSSRRRGCGCAARRKQVLANLLALLGVSAPERMDRDDA